MRKRPNLPSLIFGLVFIAIALAALASIGGRSLSLDQLGILVSVGLICLGALTGFLSRRPDNPNPTQGE